MPHLLAVAVANQPGCVCALSVRWAPPPVLPDRSQIPRYTWEVGAVNARMRGCNLEHNANRPKI